MASPVFFFCSNANWLAAASIWRRLLMQALACEVARAFTKFGIAIAANRPMMATTIMISTSVKPALRMFLFVFIVFVLLDGTGAPLAGLLISASLPASLPVATVVGGVIAKSSPAPENPLSDPAAM